MAKLRIIIARRALNDLDVIRTYITSETSMETADRVISKIVAAFDQLAEMPGMGHTRSDLPKQNRVWGVFRFLIVYRFDARSLYVNRVVHGSRNIHRAMVR